MHGEEEQQDLLKNILNEQGYKGVSAPVPGEEFKF